MQLVLSVVKLTSERMYQDNFQKRKGFGFMFGQSSKKNCSFESFGNSLGSVIGSVSSPQTTRLPQPSGWVRHRQVLLSEVGLCLKVSSLLTVSFMNLWYTTRSVLSLWTNRAC